MTFKTHTTGFTVPNPFVLCLIVSVFPRWNKPRCCLRGKRSETGPLFLLRRNLLWRRPTKVQWIIWIIMFLTTFSPPDLCTHFLQALPEVFRNIRFSIIIKWFYALWNYSSRMKIT
jgi:hypothetical protein